MVKISGKVPDSYAEILTPEALDFICSLHCMFDDQRQMMLKDRRVRQDAIFFGETVDFSPDTEYIRKGSWRVADIPKDLLCRRVELTGPVDRKMIINALNSGADVFMADFEDSNSPTWDNTIQGQINLRDAVNRTITLDTPNGKHYELKDKTAILFVRPRGWHLDEEHMTIDGEPVSASLVDFGLYFFHNARTLIDKGTGPYFYLPKLQNHKEAKLWNDVFAYSQKKLNIPYGSIRATVLIEHILAAFDAEEILLELRDHSAGLNCGRWDYIFSIIKTFAKNSNFVLPDRSKVTMTTDMMLAYAEYVVNVCMKRKIHAMGGMAAQIPIKSDPERSLIAMDKVIEDKRREVSMGFSGTWVAHPGMITSVMTVFSIVFSKLGDMHQINIPYVPKPVSAAALLKVPKTDVTEEGVRLNIRVGVQYLEAWLRGLGCVPLYNLMEDMATAEISRTQIWQWIHNKTRLADSRTMDVGLFETLLKDEMDDLRSLIGPDKFDAGKFDLAQKLFHGASVANELPDFLSLVAYKHLE